jgi:hypothetical protein
MVRVCRKARRRCGEERPVCSYCERTGALCEVPAPLCPSLLHPSTASINQ